jgi:hypothetical protein
MKSKKARLLFSLILVSMAAATAQAGSGAPNFSPAIYADGEMWGTKGTTSLPAPNNHNMQSFDRLFVFPEGAETAPGQLPVSEAGPGNPDYNGGRWATYTLFWLEGKTPALLKSYSDIMYYIDRGDLAIAEGDHNYFQCPLLPVK